MTRQRRTCNARPSLPHVHSRDRGQIYARRVTIADELERARSLAFADDEESARDLLVSLMPRIEAEDRDDLMMEVFAQLGDIYLIRGADDGVAECITRIRDCMQIYVDIRGGRRPDLAPMVTMSEPDVDAMVRRYLLRAQALDVGLRAARGDHDGASVALTLLNADKDAPAALGLEYDYCVALATVACATALGDDDLYARSEPLWDSVIARLDALTGDSSEAADRLRVLSGIAYGRFCVETGRLLTAEPWFRRSGALAERHGWQLCGARTLLERGAAAWAGGDVDTTERLVAQAYPVIAQHARAHDVSRCWLFLGLTRMALGALEQADECWGHAERHWREVGKPLHVHRILLQRSWIAIFRNRFSDAVEMVSQARGWLDSAPQRSWLSYARLDDHLGTIWRADALTDLGFDATGDPDASWAEVEARQRASLGVTYAQPGGPEFARAVVKLEKAAELKIPAALAVDSVRFTMTDPVARQRWATCVSGRLLAGAFATVWEWENTSLLSELVEYHSARGAFVAQELPSTELGWRETATAPVPADDSADVGTPADYTLVAGGPAALGARSLSRLGPLPPLQMDPTGAPVLSDYRDLAALRYGCQLTAAEEPWTTWPHA